MHWALGVCCVPLMKSFHAIDRRHVMHRPLAVLALLATLILCLAPGISMAMAAQSPITLSHDDHSVESAYCASQDNASTQTLTLRQGERFISTHSADTNSKSEPAHDMGLAHCDHCLLAAQLMPPTPSPFAVLACALRPVTAPTPTAVLPLAPRFERYLLRDPPGRA